MFRLIMISAAILFFFSCEHEPVVGSDNVDVYQDTEFLITDRDIQNGRLVAYGTIENTGSRKITPVWYIECEFYTDRSCEFKLGGGNQKKQFSLGPEEKTGWKITFSSSDYNLNEYPDFGVKNLRVYQK